MKNLFKDKLFFKTILTLAIPITIQNLITSSLNLLDNLMIGRLGEESIASVGLANQYFFLFNLVILGISSGAAVFTSQYFGQGNMKNVKRYLAININIGLITSILFAALAILYPQGIIRIFTNDAEVIKLGCSYLSVVAVSYLFTAVTQAFSFGLRSIQRAKIPMLASLIALFFNGILNYMFIFGKFGMPQMGVSGAALGTVISRFFEVAFIIAYIYINKLPVALNFKELRFFNPSYLRRYFGTASTVILNETMFALGSLAYTAAYARVGTNAIAAVQISSTINNVFSVLSMGLAMAAAIMVGNKIGENKEEQAIEYSKRLSIIAPLIGVLVGIVLFLSKDAFVGIFTVSEATALSAEKILIAMAILVPIRFFNILIIIGVFRGGGDTIHAFMIESITMWCVGVPLAFLATTFTSMSIEYVYSLIIFEEAVRSIALIPRLRSKKWIHNLTKV